MNTSLMFKSSTVSSSVLLMDHFKALNLPEFAREYEKIAVICGEAGLDYAEYLLRLCELERSSRERRTLARRLSAAKFPIVKGVESFDFSTIPSVNKSLILELAQGGWIERHENVIALGPSGVGKTHIGLALGLAACQKGYSVRFITTAALVHELLEARDEKRLRIVQKQLANIQLLIIDELGYVPLSTAGAELLFEVFSRRYEQESTLVTSNLPFNEWTSILGSER